MQCPRLIIKIAQDVTLTPMEEDDLKKKQLKKGWPWAIPHAVGLGGILEGGRRIHGNNYPLTKYGPYAFNTWQKKLLRRGRMGGGVIAGLGVGLAALSAYGAHRSGKRVKDEFLKEKEINRLMET